MTREAPAPATRLAAPADGAALVAIYRPYVETTAISFETRPPTADEMAERVARTTERWPWVVVEVDGAIRGYAYATRHRDRAAYDWTAETAVYVDRGVRRRGIGRIAMTTLLDVLRLQGFHLAVAGITPPNPGSVGLHLALGYQRVGQFDAIGFKLGAWQAVEFFSLELAARHAEPAPVRPLSEIRDTPELRRILAAGGAR